MTSFLTLRNALIAVAAALALALGFQSDWGAGWGTPTVELRGNVSKQDSVAILPDFRLGSDASTYSQVVERPLLNPSRRPAPTQLAQTAPEPPKPQVRRGLYQLVGVTDFGTARVAQLREVATNRVRSVREGDQLQELTVRKVEPAQVTLAFQGETDVIEMPKFTASGRVPQPPPPPPPPVQQTAQTAMQPPPQATTTAVSGVPSPQPVAAAAGSPNTAVAATQSDSRGTPGAPAAAPEPGPTRQVMSVGEMLERRRQARQQAGAPR